MILEHHLLVKSVYHYYLLGHQNRKTPMTTITITLTVVVYNH